MPKYKEYARRMLDANKELFEKFRVVHDRYSLDGDTLQEEYNRIGAEVMLVVKEWEGKLCRQSEKAGYSSYTTNLAEKFQAEVKNYFPLIDHVGLIIKRFAIKRITFKN